MTLAEVFDKVENIVGIVGNADYLQCLLPYQKSRYYSVPKGSLLLTLRKTAFENIVGKG